MSTLFPHAACLQLKISPGDIQANLRQFRELLAAQTLPDNTLVVLPEVWASGFDYPNAAALAEQTPTILAELQQTAAERRLWFAGSLLEPQSGGKPCNTLFLVGPNGVAGKYQKQHLFRFWQEEDYLQAGQEPLPIATPFGLLGALVCYDLRFPELSRSQVFAGSRLIVVSAQWPSARLGQWRLLAQAQAVENQAFVVACNGCGAVGEGRLAGYSLIIAPDGTILAEAGDEAECVQSRIDEAELDKLRSRFCTAGERPWPGWDKNKIVDLETLQARLALIRRQGSKVVFTNGCFDLLHAGHVDYLEQARACGDCLVVGLNADSSVRRLKGPSRPVNSENERARVLAALGCVDFITVFAEDTPQRLIRELLPDVLVKGADWPEEHIVGAAEVKASGGVVRRIVFRHQQSSSGMISRILRSCGPQG
ncbi:MAG: D-glycero-beta-D-manno-heptose 1-phosphate adenylyltransferase [Candidatus Electronema sp. V4]|uniref:D-glycero-beta-D-manno-heptose 1-phosphate adenylyltransferase n=1 Tax=Candidatus Electronema sp. V4 TaxID=3454756 RepID=UPI0040558ADA